MELNLALRPPSNSLVSFATITTSSTSVRSPCTVRSLRTEFAGSLRPPGLRSQRKCRKLGFQVHPPRIIIRASLVLPAVLSFVSVVTVSALTAVYLKYSTTKKVAKKISGSRDVEEDKSGNETNNSIKEIVKICHDSVDEVAQLRVKETAVMHKEVVINDSLKSSDIIAFSTAGSVSSLNQDEIASMSTLPSHHYESSPLPLSLAIETLERHLEVFEEGSTSVHLNNARAAVKELDKPDHIVTEEIKTDSNHSNSGESIRRALYTFYEEDHSVVRPVKKINGSKSMPIVNNSFSSVEKSSMLGEKIFAPEFLHTEEKFQGNLPLQINGKVSLHKRTNLEEAAVHSDDKHRISSMDSNLKSLLFPDSNATQRKGEKTKEKLSFNKRVYPSDPLSAYRSFLKEGRLSDCLELLEDMDEKSLLNMDKVYHAGFYRACKIQMAVKEAFRFTKLIPNPSLSTFNMLVSVCANSQDTDGAFQVLTLVQEAGLKADCKLYTTLISTCAKSGKVDLMFKVFHEMVNAGVEPNVHTYGALIDGCAKAGQVAKAFGSYGIMRSKNVKPDRVVFNALINACGQSGAVSRAFDVLAEMKDEMHPIEPDHVTIGALIKACAKAGQVDRAREVYNMIHESNIKGTPEVYTIVVNSCSETGDWEFANCVYNDMKKKGVVPDELFISALIDVAGHAGNLDAAFRVLQEAREEGIHVGIISYSSLMGACCNMKNWQKAEKLYEEIKTLNLKPTVPTMNALITALCDGDQLQMALEILDEMKKLGLRPNTITYSILFVASEKKDYLEAGLKLFAQVKKEGLAPNLVMCRCLSAMCLRRFDKSRARGEPVMSLNSGRLQIESKWTSLVLMFYRETITAGVLPTDGEFSQVLGCLRLPHDVSLKNRLIESLGISIDIPKSSNLCSLIDGFGEYDPRAFSLLEEAALLGIIPSVSLKEKPLIIDVRQFQVHTAEVYLLAVLKGLKHRLAAGVRLPNVNILVPIEKAKVHSSTGNKLVNVSGRVSQAIAALLRRLGLTYLGNESEGRIRVHGVVVRKWLQPRINAPFNDKPTDFGSSRSRLGTRIANQQRNIRTDNYSL